MAAELERPVHVAGDASLTVSEHVRAEWREPALRRLSQHSARIGVIAVLMIVVQVVATAAHDWTAWMAAGCSLLLVLALRVSAGGWGSYGQRVLLIAGMLGLYAFVAGWIAGPSPPSLIALLAAITLLACYLSTQAALKAGLVSVVLMGGLGVMQTTGVLHPPPVEYLSPLNPYTWPRLLINSCFAGSFVIFTITALLRERERVMAQRELAHLDSLREEAEKTRCLQAKLEVQGAMLALQKRDAYAQLAAGVAHDFNNQLMVVLGWTDLLRLNRAASEERNEALERIADACQHMSSLSRELLTLGRGTLQLSGRCAPDRVIGQQAKSLRRVLPSDIRITLELDCEREVSLHASQLEQIVLNLVLNARDAMPNGGLLGISTDVVSDENASERVSVRVTDNGAGMTPEVLAQLFRPLFTTKGERGMGLGLASVQALVELAKGRIDVESEPGRGTSMRIELPALVAAAQPEAALLMDRSKVDGRALLLLEYDEQVRTVLEALLRGVGYSVLPAASLEAALESLRRHRGTIDVCCIDAKLPAPQLNVLAAEYRASFPDGMVLLMTSGEPVEENGLIDAQTRIIGKPFGLREIVSCVSDARNARGQGTA